MFKQKERTTQEAKRRTKNDYYINIT